MNRAKFSEIKSSLAEKGVIEILAEGNSMLPTIKHGEKILVMPDKLQFGDIAVFFDAKKKALLCHRLVWLSNGKHIFKGDNSFNLSKQFGADFLLGKVFVESEGNARRSKIIAFFSLLQGVLLGTITGSRVYTASYKTRKKLLPISFAKLSAILSNPLLWIAKLF